ncbi:hypothetical protein K5X82_10895 [Halosquirtibacter xylanolyticus]|uniref:HU domain-containing protein n=1 Tax=Halosquirtibacter xylanolyticus TaxID=3374599 RepID=UPI0037479A60|nr:hypothetical protein K5X82_10895 [Prolixibacteraceae bacterium]
MRLEQLFHTWLEKNNCIIIPNIGALIVQHIPAKWNSKERLFKAPHTIVSFNNHIVKDDGGLAHLICNSQKCNFKVATDLVIDWTLWCYKSMLHGEKILLDNLGTLNMDANGFISMKMISQKSMLELNYFGLEDIILSSNHLSSSIQFKGKQLWRTDHIVPKVAAAAVLLMILCIPNATPDYFNSSSEASMIPYTEEVPIAPIDSEKEEELIQIQIIAGSFRNRSNAQNVLNKLEVILPSRFHIISKGDQIYQVCSTQLFHPNGADKTVDIIQATYPNIGLWKKKFQ